MAKAKMISDVQADILTTAMDTGTYNGERIPWSIPIGLCATWSQPLAGLIKRGYLDRYKRNMCRVTPEGEAALKAWEEYIPPMKTFR